MAIFAATLEGKVTSEEIEAVEGLPPSKFPRELMVKLGYNPPLPDGENVSEKHQPANPAVAQDGESASGDEWPPDDMQILFAMRAAQMAGTFSQADADRMDEGPKETWPPDLWAKLGFSVPLASALLQQDNKSPEDSADQAWAALKAKGYPKQDSDPATGETFPVFPETVMQDEEHPLYYSLPDNARPETWRELDSAVYNPSKARTA